MPYKDKDVARLYWKERYERNRNSNSGNKDPIYTLCETCGEPIRTCMSRVLSGKAIYCPKHRYDRLFGHIPWNKGMHKETKPHERNFKRHRDYALYKEWHNECLKRDWYKCQLCESKERLEVHHIKSYRDYPNDRVKLDNGITLCKKCHLWVERVNPLDFQ